VLSLTDAPDAPENLQASDVHADHLKLSWLPPSDDGGSDITGRSAMPVAYHRKFHHQNEKNNRISSAGVLVFVGINH